MRGPSVSPARVVRHTLGRWVDPSLAWVALLADEPTSFWLDDGSGAGVSYLGAGARTATGPGILEIVRAGIREDQVVDAPGEGFCLGWVGWLGYEFRSETMGDPVARSERYRSSAFLFVERALAFDHGSGEVVLLALGDEWTGELAAWRDATIAALEAPLPLPLPLPQAVPATAAWADADEKYLRMIAECQSAIRAGDAYQLCLTTEARIAGDFDPFTTYLALRASSPAHHGGLIRIDGVALLSASPEQFLTVTPDGVVESRPIKGTRPRGDNPESDARLADELLASDKERAENLMIVDLMRNDIGRVSELGSVAVTGLFSVESYPHVHQLVSTVSGRLADGLDGLDAVAACFPAGSMTGAPKLSATRILDRLEGRSRGIYAGAFGYFSLDGRVDLAMVIRSIVLDGDGATVGAGGGITALSVPLEELAEVRLKAAALLAVLGAGA